ncbi:MAG: adenosine kinase [Alphaproteobacteria bacterium]|nr:adenosine kinase [Alphaproteobacteria bacterium]
MPETRPETRHDVVGIGNAIVDVLAHADDGFLAREGLAKGTMALIDAERADTLYGRMGPGIEMSGGSAANTMAGIASLGGRAAYIGKVRDDALGGIFRHDITAAGVTFATPPATAGAATARCLILVTPDAQRTMSTYLGACVDLGPDEVDEATVAGAAVTYLEGYLFDPPKAREAFVRAARLARKNGRKVALSLSDPFCVDRHRGAFRAFVRDHVDVLFANEVEVLSLTGAVDFDGALQAIRATVPTAVLTRSAKGSVVVAGAEVHVIDAAPVARVVDTTGAGDLYASGFLHGLTAGRDLAACGRLGALAAAEVIGHFGARPETPLAEYVRRHFA